MKKKNRQKGCYRAEFYVLEMLAVNRLAVRVHCVSSSTLTHPPAHPLMWCLHLQSEALDAFWIPFSAIQLF